MIYSLALVLQKTQQLFVSYIIIGYAFNVVGRLNLNISFYSYKPVVERKSKIITDISNIVLNLMHRNESDLKTV
jgi:hypothetical protein